MRYTEQKEIQRRENGAKGDAEQRIRSKRRYETE